MNGETLKAQLLKIEPTLVEVAKKLDMSKQNLDAKLSTADIKTGFIEQLAAIYNRPISYFFGRPECAVISDMSHHSDGDNAKEIRKAGRDYYEESCQVDKVVIDALTKEIEHLTALLAEKDKRIDVLEKSLARKDAQLDRLIALMEKK